MRNKVTPYLLIISFILGLMFVYSNQINITNIALEKQGKNNYIFFNLVSNKKKEVNLQFSIPGFIVKSISCNDKYVKLIRTKDNYKFLPSSYSSISIERGISDCVGYLAEQTDYPEYDERLDILSVKTKMIFHDFMISLLLLGIPIFICLSFLFSWIIGRISKNKTTDRRILPLFNQKRKVEKLLLFILFLGITIRGLYFYVFGPYLFQHDWSAHVELIFTILNNGWTLPLPSTGLEFPQQPLYYIITGFLYSFSVGIVDDPFQVLGLFSLFSSFIFLLYIYKIAFLLNLGYKGRLMFLSFFSFLPSIVFISARINNDALVLPLMAISIYYILTSYASGFKTSFWTALFFTSFLFLTKLSASPIEIFFFILLLDRALFGNSKKYTSIKLEYFILIGLFVLSIALFRDWQPIENSFRFINSAAYPDQTIPSLSFDYFTSFPYLSLLDAKQCAVFGDDTIRYHFLSYIYGTMFVGEFDYSTLQYGTEIAKSLISYSILMMYFFGISIPIGVIYYLSRLGKRGFFGILLVSLVVYTILLVISLLFKYPSVCNTDFRYLEISFIFIGYIVVSGIRSFSYSKSKFLNLFGKIVEFSFFSFILWSLLFLILLIGYVSNV